MSNNGNDEIDRYDNVFGEASIWQAASNLVAEMKSDEQSEEWNTALDQAARRLESEARGIRQGNGMYYRAISGSRHEPLADE